MASNKILFPFILVSVLSIATIEAQNEPTYLESSCTNDTTNNDSAFISNVMTLLNNFSTSAIGDTQFRNLTINGNTPSDSVHGMFMCRGDVLPQLCQQCVLNATQDLLSDCLYSQDGVIWYNECMVRYSNNFFFSTVDTTRIQGFYKTVNASNPESFMRLLFSTMNQTADEASRPIGHKKYATRKANVSESQTLYCLAQCTPDLSPYDCSTCLSIAIRNLSWGFEGTLGRTLVYYSCIIRFEVFPFYLSLSPTLPPPLVPATNTSKEDLVYLSHNCSSFTANNTFHTDLMTLLSFLSSNATSGKGFHMANVSNRAYGLFMCRGDLTSRLCQQCVLNATHRISSECRSMQEAIIWYNSCMLRYSHRYFFYNMDTSPIYSELNITSTSSPNPEQKFFIIALTNTLSELADEAGSRVERYGTKSQKLNDLQTLYTSAQCTQDLSPTDCWSCLDNVIMNTIPWSRLGGIGGRVLYPSCNLRFESFQFYGNGDEAQSPTSASPSELGPTDSQRQKVLSWFERFTIIGGIARGILYMHEHSRLKVIHRDLKPSNVLLDENMIPKISDFGLARIVELNINQGSTSRIVGTYGYISPEYAMFGQFSEKSDVFSFGVMVLEIVSGKKNLSSYESHRIGDGFLSHVWRQWRNQIPLSILDPNIKENYSEIEVIKCIQIGLLCVQQNPDDRPTMDTIISYLSNDSIELPNPQEPAFFIRGRMDSTEIAQSSSGQSINSSTLLSNNELSMSTTFLPR